MLAVEAKGGASGREMEHKQDEGVLVAFSPQSTNCRARERLHRPASAAAASNATSPFTAASNPHLRF